MRYRRRTVQVFGLSMLDVLSGALGAFLLIMIVLMKRPDIVRLHQLEEALEKAEERSTQLAQQLEDAQAEADAMLAELEQQAEEARERLGLELQDKRVVFVVDVSGSMNEGRIDEVRAGLKMLVATMDDSYMVDVVFFPNVPASSNYGVMWGGLQTISEARKYDIYNFLSDLDPSGGTPTTEALEFVLGQYGNAGTILLFSDGEPDGLSSQWSATTNNQLSALLQFVRSRNSSPQGCVKKINAVGVGSSFRDMNSQTVARAFLERLAEENCGFYVGF